MSSLEEFLVFKDVAYTGNITRTSERLHMSQPSVSIHIQNLEKEYGTQFLDRTNRGVTLTESGEVFYGYTKEVVQLISEAREAVHKMSNGHRGIRIGATFTIGEYILPYLIQEYCAGNLDHCVDARIADTEILTREIMDKRLHIALIEGPVPEDPNFNVKTFWHDELVVVVPASHPWSTRETVSFSELATETIVMREQGSGTRRVMETALSRNGFNPLDLHIRLELGIADPVRTVFVLISINLGLNNGNHCITMHAISMPTLLG